MIRWEAAMGAPGSRAQVLILHLPVPPVPWAAAHENKPGAHSMPGGNRLARLGCDVGLRARHGHPTAGGGRGKT